jgi:enediyne polyketide synthase
LPSQLVLGDPAVRDTALHAIQACVPDVSLLPVGADRIHIGAKSDSGPWLMHAVERAHDGDLFAYDVEVIDRDGIVVEKWEGLRLKAIAGTERQGAWVAPLLGPYMERRIKDYIPTAEVSVAVDSGVSQNRKDKGDQTIRRALGREAAINRRPDGKPEVPGGVHVSVSYAGSISLAVVSPSPIGCDVEPVVERPPAIWQDLLGQERYQATIAVRRASGETEASAATRVWAIGECLTKMGANTDVPVLLDRFDRDDWVMFSCGPYKAATTIVPVIGCDHPLVLAVLVRNNCASV